MSPKRLELATDELKQSKKRKQTNTTATVTASQQKKIKDTLKTFMLNSFFVSNFK